MPRGRAPIDGCLWIGLGAFFWIAVIAAFFWIPWAALEEQATERGYGASLLMFGFYVAGFCLALYKLVDWWGSQW